MLNLALPPLVAVRAPTSCPRANNGTPTSTLQPECEGRLARLEFENPSERRLWPTTINNACHERQSQEKKDDDQSTQRQAGEMFETVLRQQPMSGDSAPVM